MIKYYIKKKIVKYIINIKKKMKKTNKCSNNYYFYVDENECKTQLQVIGFWKVNKPYGFLSQWYCSNFTENNMTFNTGEKYMMYKKALLFDPTSVDVILRQNNPATLKKMGRSISNFDQKVWDENKYLIIYTANYLKFSQDENLKKQLLDTKNLILAEASPIDKIYGIGLEPDNPNVQDINKWKGENLLGKALMDVRKNLSY